MRGGVNALMFTAALATAGCVTDSDKVQIRPLADPFTKATRAGSPAVAEGRGLLAAGSVGLAIEAFRKALREQPDSIEALAGLAECYDQMGRHDLSQAKYEAALAIAPNDPTLLRTFAASLERQGRFAEATELRGEADDAAKAEAAALERLAPVVLAPVQRAPTPKIAVVAPPPQRAPAKLVPAQSMPAPIKIAAPQPQAAPVQLAPAQPKPAPTLAAAEVAQLATAPAKPVDVQLKSASLVSSAAWAIDVAPIAPPVEAAASVTIKLPPVAQPRAEAPKVAAAVPPRAELPKADFSIPAAPAKVATTTPPPVEAAQAALSASAPAQPAKVEVAAAPSVTVKLPPARPAVALPSEKPLSPPVRKLIADVALNKPGPRLERLSLAEVALVTDPRPRWRTPSARQVAIGAPPRFVPLAELQYGHGVRLLNAARHEGLAARTRLSLNRQGWKSVTIGDSARVRQRSLVLYSEKTEKEARRLAAQFGFWIAREARPGPLTILLGRDWATRSQSRA